MFCPQSSGFQIKLFRAQEVLNKSIVAISDLRTDVEEIKWENMRRSVCMWKATGVIAAHKPRDLNSDTWSIPSGHCLVDGAPTQTQASNPTRSTARNQAIGSGWTRGYPLADFNMHIPRRAPGVPSGSTNPILYLITSYSTHRSLYLQLLEILGQPIRVALCTLACHRRFLTASAWVLCT